MYQVRHCSQCRHILRYDIGLVLPDSVLCARCDEIAWSERNSRRPTMSYRDNPMRNYDSDLYATAERAMGEEEPTTWVGNNTKGVFAAFCSLGEDIAEGTSPTTTTVACAHIGCVCKAEEDDSFRLATKEEAYLFWDGMKSLADQALYEIEHDL